MGRRLGWLVVAVWLAARPAGAQMVAGTKVPGFEATFGVSATAAADFSAQLLDLSLPAGVLWPGDRPAFRVQVVNTSKAPLRAEGRLEVVAYGTRGRAGDIWVGEMFRLASCGSVPVAVDLSAGGFVNLSATPPIPERFGAYGLVLELPGHGRRFVTSCVRTFQPTPTKVQFPQLCLDVTDPAVLTRLGAYPNRVGIAYKPTTDKDFESWYARQSAQLTAYKTAGLPVTVEIGGGAFYAKEQPLGRPRPWLNDAGVMQDTKFDLAWLPSYDADFRLFVKRLLTEHAWPRGCVNSIKLWNEPWEGISISGWGADLPRYREIFRALCEATDEVRRATGASVLTGGCDSSSNTFDKLFGDGQDDFLKYLDFCSIHYQGMAPPSTVKAWRDRQGPRGRVRIWDTESWVANVDDRVAAVVATNLSTGHDRAVGIYGGNIATEWHSTGVNVFDDQAKGKRKRIDVIHVWSVAAAVGATNHFLGERRFRELLFRNGLPWIEVFDGLTGPEDGTVVVVGDIGEEFGADSVLFRTARGQTERAHKRELRAQLAALPADSPARARLEAALAKDEPLSGGSLTLPADPRYSLYDFYGNPVPGVEGRLTVPLDHRGFFLRGNGAPGAFKALLDALRTARTEGLEPLAKVCCDLTAPIEHKPTLRLRLTNVLNRPIHGNLSLTLGQLPVFYPRDLFFRAHETREVLVRVLGGTPTASNSYPLSLTFDAGADGTSTHDEVMHVNVIARRTVKVDGDLSDWDGVLPQTVSGAGTGPTLAEAAWFPFKTFDTSVTKGFGTGYLAYDADNFYFAAKIADATPDEGLPRFATLNPDEYYYPEVSHAKGKQATDPLLDLTWPAGVRHYSYRQGPVLPCGNAPDHDNVQLAFNVLSAEQKPWYPCPPGTMPGYIGYYDTDYEYALNPVAPRYGGGTELWRLRVPGMPHKHFYPRQPASRFDGPVPGGQLALRRDGHTRYVECALPWRELPAVKAALDARRTIKFSFRVNDNGGGGSCLELSRQRSVAKRNGSFLADWREHWANELEFAFER